MFLPRLSPVRFAASHKLLAPAASALNPLPSTLVPALQISSVGILCFASLLCPSRYYPEDNEKQVDWLLASGMRIGKEKIKANTN